MLALIRDVRYGFRSLIASPALTIVAVLALTLGIGLTTTMFSIVYGALMKGLPFPDGDRIVRIARDNAARQITNGSIPVTDLARFRAEQHSFDDLATFTAGTMNVSGTERAERVSGAWVSANLFSLISVEPVAGHGFKPGDDAPGGPSVAILSYSLWESRYNRSPSAIGQTIRVNGAPFEIIGVMPEKFEFPQTNRLWLPLQANPIVAKRDDASQVEVVGKLRPGVSIDQASLEIAATQARISADYKQTDDGFTASVRSYVDADIGPQPRQLLYTMLGAVFFVLLIACSNVANLLIDRAAHRTKEVGIRAALGATRGAIISQFLSEAFLLTIGGTALGLVVAKFGVDAFNRSIAGNQDPIPFYIDIRLHPAVLAFTAVVSLIATIFSGVIPAYQASRADINEILKDETRGSSSLRIGKISKALVMFEVALSCGLLVAAGLTVKSVVKMRTLDPGFATANVFTARVGFPSTYTDLAARLRFFTQLAERVGALPGVQGAAMSSGLPGARQGLDQTDFAVAGKAYASRADYPRTRTLSVTSGFFAALDIPLREGRLLNSGDRAGTQRVVVVNERFARTYFPNESPLGRLIRYGGPDSQQPWATIVGVIPTTFGGQPDDPRPALVVQPFEQAPSSFAYISARTPTAPMALATAVRDVANDLNPDIPLYWVMSLDHAIAAPLWFVRIFGSMFMIFGFVALFLASIGLFAVMSFSVSRRTREVGIRVALGAQRGDVIRLVFGQGLLQVAVGLSVGLVFAVGISKLLSLILFDVQPRDPAVFGGVAVLLLLTGALACLLPAIRATKVDPLNALRAE